MADEANRDVQEVTSDPLCDSNEEVNEENEESSDVYKEDISFVYKLNEEIDNLNLVLDHLERKNGDINSRIEKLLASLEHPEIEEE